MLGRCLVSFLGTCNTTKRLHFRRKQKIADRQRVNGFARLYQALRTLQAEIEEMMPDFEEQMDILTYGVLRFSRAKLC